MNWQLGNRQANSKVAEVRRKFGGAKELHNSRSNQFMTDTNLQVSNPALALSMA